ncbi:hypothetical protein BTW10_13045 [Chromohalobacter japonicus]|uniref:Uncharacterized protein n=1 Tax=Chromohalobacter japonicus TaxID=223900 RepID=A0A1Q8TAC3_9GAMM|nr:hypothetical protein [Chromohalobacter japonicus]OLO10627.1 hypothetical protein BTW10_13045 [Chromohalobacter japonicus]
MKAKTMGGILFLCVAGGVKAEPPCAPSVPVQHSAEYCRGVATYGRTIMGMRQDGVPESLQRDMWAENDLGSMAPYVDSAISMAYRVGLLRQEWRKQVVKEDFYDLMFSKCMCVEQ